MSDQTSHSRHTFLLANARVYVPSSQVGETEEAGPRSVGAGGCSPAPATRPADSPSSTSPCCGPGSTDPNRCC